MKEMIARAGAGLAVGVSAILLAAASPASAETVMDLLNAKPSYTAGLHIVSGKIVLNGEAAHSRGSTRETITLPNGKRYSMLMQFDSGTTYVLDEGARQYFKADAATLMSFFGPGLDRTAVTRTRIGDEKVGTIAATHYSLATAPGANQPGLTGDIWLTAEGIPVRVLLHPMTAKDNSTDIEITLDALKIGKIDASLTKLPQGFTALN